MQVYREYRATHSDEIVIKLPRSFRDRELEIIVKPTTPDVSGTLPLKPLKLKTFKCFGKKKDFSRDDAYEDRL